MLIGAAAVPLVVALPTSGPTPQADLVTLERLAAEGKFVSATHELPPDVCTARRDIWLNGRPYHEPVAEIYAPGDESGWAVVFDDLDTGNTSLVKGNWSFRRKKSST